MQNALDKIFDQTQNIIILDFAEKYIYDILQIQAETGLSFWSKNDYLSELGRADSIFKIARNADEKIIAFVLVHLLNSNSNTSFDSSEIINIGVRGSFQHKGIGQMILDEILRSLKSKNVSEIWLEVRASNAKAIAFIKKTNLKCSPQE